MNLTPEKVLRVSRVSVYRRRRWFMVPLMKLRDTEVKGSGKIAVSGRNHLFYDPEKVVEWSEQFMPTFLYHEVQHIIRNHPAEMAEWLKSHGSRAAMLMPFVQMLWPFIQSVPMLYNVAEDMSINDDLEAEGEWPWPPNFKPCIPKMIDAPVGKGAGFYAEVMLAKAEELKKEMESQPQPQGGGGGSDETDEGTPAQDDGEGSDDEEAGDGDDDSDGSGGEDGDDEADGEPDSEGDDTSDESGAGDGSGTPQDDDSGADGQGDDGAGSAPAGESPQSRPQEGSGAGCCGSCSGHRESWEPADDDPSIPQGMTDSELDLMRRRVALDIEEAAKEAADGRGTMPGDYWLQWSKKMLAPPKVRWQSLFAKRLRGAVTIARGRVDWKNGPPSRRREVAKQFMGDEAPLFPVLRGPSPRVVFIVDVSGSMMGDRIKRAFSEALGIAKACTHVPCGGIAVDARVQASVQRVRNANDLVKLNRGGGGTDMRIGIKAAEEMKEPPEVIVLVTDGETPWPRKQDMPKKADLLTCIVNRNRHYYDNIPAYIKKYAVLVEED